MTDQERRQAIEEFIEYAGRQSTELGRRWLGAPRKLSALSEREIEDLIERYLLERISS